MVIHLCETCYCVIQIYQYISGKIVLLYLVNTLGISRYDPQDIP